MGVYIKDISYEDLIFRADDKLANWLMEQDIVLVDEPHGRLVDIDKAIGLIASGVRLEIGELSELTTVIEAEGE